VIDEYLNCDYLDLHNLFTDFLASNRGPGYQIAVTDAAINLSQIEVAITFISGRTYCCAEPFCHVPDDLMKLIRFAAARGVSLPPELKVRWHFIVENGVQLSCNKSLGLPLAVNHQEYDAVSAVHTIR
jgi:hypothetical protein